jgi:hypothetical protein
LKQYSRIPDALICLGNYTRIGLAFCIAGPFAADEIEPAAEPIPPGSTIGQVHIERSNIFDLSDEEEDKWLYRLMNKLHIVTREKTVDDQLLFQPGDSFDPRVIAESERILRANKYLWDAEITPSLDADGNVDVKVWTRDVWTLTPEITLSRDGGENRTVFGIEESNLLGRGQRVLIFREDNVDRSSNSFEFYDRQIGSSWVSVGLSLADNSDGHANRLYIVKPFHALDARGAGGVDALEDDRITTLYDLGDEAAEFRHQRRRFQLFGGHSKGVIDNWVSRWTYGVVYDDNRFSEPRDPDPDLQIIVPADRKLVYPFLGFEILEDRYEKSSNSNQIDRAEDFYLGTRLAVTLGWSDTGIGADRDALVYAVDANMGFGTLKKRALLLSGFARGREESGNTANSTVGLDASYYWRQSDKMLFFSSFSTTIGHNLDIDHPIEIGGDSGLRGYPLRYQAGDSRLVMSVEQRYFTDWYPFRLVRVGAAVFADVGRVWGDNPQGAPNLGWLRDVGIGLRFAPTRLGSTKVFHLDLAFPLDGDPSIDDVQILFKARRGF